MSNNKGFESAKITEDGEEVVSKFSRLLEHKVTYKDLIGYNLALISICLGIVYFLTTNIFSFRIEYLEKELVEQNSKFEKQEDKITNLLLEVERLKK